MKSAVTASSSSSPSAPLARPACERRGGGARSQDLVCCPEPAPASTLPEKCLQTTGLAGALAGATRLEPATSGATGRSWRLRAGPGYAGIHDVSRSFRYTRCGIGGRRPDRPAGSGGLCERGDCLIRERPEKLGVVTPLVAPGQSATLRLTLDRGTFTYVCTVPGRAAAGMKGALRVQ